MSSEEAGRHFTYGAGGFGGGGLSAHHTGPVTSTVVGRSKGAVKKKTLLFNSLEVSYDYDTKELKVVNSVGAELAFDEEEVIELRAALTTFGLGQPEPSGVTCR